MCVLYCRRISKIASGWMLCARRSQWTRKICEKLRMRPNSSAKIVQKLCSDNFHAILGGDDSEVPKMLLHKLSAFLLNLDNKASCTGDAYLNPKIIAQESERSTKSCERFTF